jgi:hypothetical protein
MCFNRPDGHRHSYVQERMYAPATVATCTVVTDTATTTATAVVTANTDCLNRLSQTLLAVLR